jgi:4-aminobutyrate aminotransferase / (S)-3-amino-2-methylpropionate transaminase / 5-aminovalerate transaminase
MTGNDLPELVTSIPGPRSRAWVDRLALRECPAITARRARRAAVLGRADDDPPVWVESRGVNVRDADGNLLVDLTAGFGASSVGHAHPAVVAAGQRQLAALPHAMGDAYFHPGRVELLEELAGLTGLERAILGSSGSDAVEAALKTTRMATGRDRVLAFDGSYHGLSYGALPVTGYNAGAFRAPFAGQLGQHVQHAPFGGSIPDLSGFAAVIVEPIQGRGGVREPPPGWLASLSERARAAGALLVFDEIFTGMGRTGSWFAFQRAGVIPDLLCIGKGLGGGFPISACLGSAAVMDAWGASTGQAIHTQTFLGNPVGCAMALATIGVIRDQGLPGHAAREGAWFAQALAELPGVQGVRGCGLMVAPELGSGSRALAASRGLLRRGWIVLPAGEAGDVLAFTPPLTIHRRVLEGAVTALRAVLEDLG